MGETRARRNLSDMGLYSVYVEYWSLFRYMLNMEYAEYGNAEYGIY